MAKLRQYLALCYSKIGISTIKKDLFDDFRSFWNKIINPDSKNSCTIWKQEQEIQSKKKDNCTLTIKHKQDWLIIINLNTILCHLFGRQILCFPGIHLNEFIYDNIIVIVNIVTITYVPFISILSWLSYSKQIKSHYFRLRT